jgi:hypothetical protein
VLEAERVPDRDDDLTDAQLSRIGKRERVETRRRNLQHRQIGIRIRSDDGCRARTAVGQHDAQLSRTLDDVSIGENEPVWREHESGAAAAGRVNLDDPGRDDVDSTGDGAGIRVEQVVVVIEY